MDKIQRDQNQRSLLEYGTFAFPLAVFDDKLTQYRNGMIDWHWHEEIEFIYIRRNSVLCFAGELSMELEAGNGMFIGPNVLHSFKSDKGGELSSLVFAPTFMASTASQVYTNCIAPLLNGGVYSYVFLSGEQKHRPVLEQLRLFIDENDRTGRMRPLDLAISTLQLWRCFLECLENDQIDLPHRSFSRAQQRTQDMLQFIRGHYTDTLTLADIASAAQVSCSEARRCFERILQTSPIRYLNEYRLSKAVDLLRKTDLSITDIAGRTGFSSVSYFDRLFHRQYDISPYQMRRLQDPSK